jgi:hypothetical protein
MSTQAQLDRLAELLRTHRTTLLNTVIQQAQREVPAYTRMPQVALIAGFGATVDAIIATVSQRDPSILAEHLETIVRQRLSAGMPIDGLLLASRLIQEAARDLVLIEFADDPALQASAFRRIDMVAAVAGQVLGRVNLATLLNQPPR